MMIKYMCLVLFITWYQLADCHPAKSSDLKSIDSMIDKESQAFLTAEAEESSHKAVRDKRTIGFLRQLFPGLSQIVDRKIQQITRFLFRVIGRLVLRGGGGGGGGGGNAAGGGGDGGSAAGGGDGGNGRRISITLPTYPPSADDEEEEQTEVPPPADSKPAASVAADSTAAGTNDVSPSNEASKADSASVPSANADPAPVPSANADSAPVPSANADSAPVPSATESVPATDSSTDPATTVAATAAADIATTTIATPTTQTNGVNTNVVKRKVRDVSNEETNVTSPKKRSPLTETDDVSSSSDNDLSDTSAHKTEDAEKAETNDDPRNKRFLLNLGAGENGGGGSGNFVFDLIRLIAGSGANQERDESTSGSAEDAAQEVRADVNAKEDGYSVGVPGPLTRIFVIGNRGIANLVQDLILRLAQTTERIVNFKARLITSLI